MPTKIVFVCGSPGAGKSTIVNSMAENKKYRILNVGTLMMESAVKSGYVKDRDELRFLGNKRLNELQINVFKSISKIGGNVILDTHATVEQNGRYQPGITIENMKYLNTLVGFIYIDSLTEDIAKRRKSDRTRRREHERPELIDVQRLINISILSACSTYLDLPLYVVFNDQGKLEESIGQIKEHMGDLFGV